MKALAKLERAPGLTLTDVKKPEVGHNDVMIRITRTAICGSSPIVTNSVVPMAKPPTVWCSGCRASHPQ